MSFDRPDTRIYDDYEAIDMNDPASQGEAVEYALPEGFSDKAKACWRYFDGSAFLFAYKGRLVMTDESLYLTEHGDGTSEAPFGAPRAEFDAWDEVEAWLEAVYDELLEDGLV